MPLYRGPRQSLLGGRGDAYGYDGIPDIVHAYEPARRVLASYAGDLIRLRRASDNNEANFSYTDSGELDTAAIAIWAGGASDVVTVYDQAPAGDDITQAVALGQPLYVASAQNGHAGMSFDGVNQYLQGAYTTGGALSQPVSIFAVAQLDAGSVNDGVTYNLIHGDDGVNRIILRQHTPPAPDAWAIYAGVFLIGGASDANWNVWAVLANGATSEFWINGTSEAAGDTGAGNPDGITIGADNAGNSPWKGHAVSVVVCDPSLGNAQRVEMQNAMNDYWSCY